MSVMELTVGTEGSNALCFSFLVGSFGCLGFGVGFGSTGRLVDAWAASASTPGIAIAVAGFFLVVLLLYVACGLGSALGVAAARFRRLDGGGAGVSVVPDSALTLRLGFGTGTIAAA
jgi:hypothetical protein